MQKTRATKHTLDTVVTQTQSGGSSNCLVSELYAYNKRPLPSSRFATSFDTIGRMIGEHLVHKNFCIKTRVNKWGGGYSLKYLSATPPAYFKNVMKSFVLYAPRMLGIKLTGD